MTETPNETMLFEASSNPVDTGLVPAPVTAPVTVPALPAGMDVAKSLELIDALARNLYDEDYTIKHFNLTKDDFAALSANEWFKKAVDVARTQWGKAENVHQRLAIETALVIEKNLPALSKRMGSNTEPLAGVVALAKLFAEIAGTVGIAAKAPEGTRERFNIVFNLGADVQQFNKNAPLVQIQSSEGTSSASLQSLLEAPGVPATLQDGPKGS